MGAYRRRWTELGQDMEPDEGRAQPMLDRSEEFSRTTGKGTRIFWDRAAPEP